MTDVNLIALLGSSPNHFYWKELFDKNTFSDEAFHYAHLLNNISDPDMLNRILDKQISENGGCVKIPLDSINSPYSSFRILRDGSLLAQFNNSECVSFNSEVSVEFLDDAISNTDHYLLSESDKSCNTDDVIAYLLSDDINYDPLNSDNSKKTILTDFLKSVDRKKHSYTLYR
jgi:hypothetical protein